MASYRCNLTYHAWFRLNLQLSASRRISLTLSLCSIIHWGKFLSTSRLWAKTVSHNLKLMPQNKTDIKTQYFWGRGIINRGWPEHAVDKPIPGSVGFVSNTLKTTGDQNVVMTTKRMLSHERISSFCSMLTWTRQILASPISRAGAPLSNASLYSLSWEGSTLEHQFIPSVAAWT